LLRCQNRKRSKAHDVCANERRPSLERSYKMKELSTQETECVSGGIYVQLAWAVGGWVGGNMLNSILQSGGGGKEDFFVRIQAA